MKQKGIVLSLVIKGQILLLIILGIILYGAIKNTPVSVIPRLLEDDPQVLSSLINPAGSPNKPTLEDYLSIVQRRNIFAPMVKTTSPSTLKEDSQLELTGIISDPQGLSAAFLIDKTGKEKLYYEGEMVGSYKIKSIQRDKIILADSEGSETVIKLRDFASAPGPPASTSPNSTILGDRTSSTSQPSYEGTISGTVTDEQGMPIPNVTVYAHTTDKRYKGVGRVTTDASGYYEIKNIASQGEVRIMAWAQGYARTKEGLIRITPPATGVDLILVKRMNRPDDMGQAGDGGTISGTVTDEQGMPIPNVTVYAHTTDKRYKDVGRITTDASGYYEIKNIVYQGEVRMVVWARGYIRTIKSARITPPATVVDLVLRKRR